MDRTELLTKLRLAWKRAFQPYMPDSSIYAIYLEEALTGFVHVIDQPIIGEFKGQKTVMVPLSVWMLLKHLGSDTVTPFRIVAQGKSVIVGAWQPHTGLKYAVRNEALSPCTVHIPISEFKPL